MTQYGDFLDERERGTVTPSGNYKPPTALHSLYGGAVARNALAGHAGKPQEERPQEVWTPDWILDVARAAFGGRIALDPCGASSEPGWYADVTYTGPDGVSATWGGGRLVIPADGLASPWDPSGTFYNPPFADLERWLRKCAAEPGKRIGLFPVRPHRRWFLETIRDAGGTIVFLHYNVKFKGHTSAFPAPLCLASWGCEIPDLGERETGRWP